MVLLTFEQWRLDNQHLTVAELKAIAQPDGPVPRFTFVCGSGMSMDNRSHLRLTEKVVNKLPVRCAQCGFPDIDYVASPYALIRARTKRPNELADAELGNFLVRERARKVLELVCPGACTFVPTVYEKSSEATPWYLAVPDVIPEARYVAARIPHCATCGEPRSAHKGSEWERDLIPQWAARIEIDLRGMQPGRDRDRYEAQYQAKPVVIAKWPPDGYTADVYKSSAWSSQVFGHSTFGDRTVVRWMGWADWISRDLYLSTRLYHLFKAAKIRGLDALTDKPSAEMKAWVGEHLAMLVDHGLAAAKVTTPNTKKTSPFQRFIKAHGRKGADEALDAAGNLKSTTMLPPSYQEFIAKVGAWTFDNVDGEEGYTVTIVETPGVDAVSYRRGKIGEEDDAESREVDGIMIAVAIDGDCFCFDMAQPGPEYPIVQYLHELDYFEPYASSFVEFVERLITSA